MFNNKGDHKAMHEDTEKLINVARLSTWRTGVSFEILSSVLVHLRISCFKFIENGNVIDEGSSDSDWDSERDEHAEPAPLDRF